MEQPTDKTRKYADSQYYEAIEPGHISEYILKYARNLLYNKFISLISPTFDTKIIDVGVSDIITPGANILEKNYPHPANITAVGLGDEHDFKKAFPDTTYVCIDANKPLPFPENSFDVAWANAVLEHVGSGENQRSFIADLLRVAPQVLLTVPNRYFPVEHHTAIVLLHYSDTLFRIACRALKRERWADETNLILMSKTLLRRLVPDGVEARIGYAGLGIGPFRSNLYLHLTRPLAPAGRTVLEKEFAK